MRVAHGLYGPEEDDPLRAWALVLPASGRFTHLTAARAYGWWLPPLPDDLPVFVAMDSQESRPQREGLQVSRHARIEDALIVDGLPLASPAETLLACARDLRPLDLVVLADACLRMHPTERGAVADLAATRRRGAPMMRRALGLADARSESAWETLLRRLHEVCDVPVEPQVELCDAAGQFLARVDLLVTGTNAIHEYDGADHLTRHRQRSDLGRSRGLGNHGYVRRGYTSVEVLHQAVGILRDADLSLGREHRPDRVRAWHALLSESLFTPRGQVLFRQRLGLRDPP